MKGLRTFLSDPISEYDNFSFHQIPFGYLLFNLKKTDFLFCFEPISIRKTCHDAFYACQGANQQCVQIIVFYRKQSIQANNLQWYIYRHTRTIFFPFISSLFLLFIIYHILFYYFYTQKTCLNYFFSVKLILIG